MRKGNCFRAINLDLSRAKVSFFDRELAIVADNEDVTSVD